jgi:hypothetical protein
MTAQTNQKPKPGKSYIFPRVDRETAARITDMAEKTGLSKNSVIGLALKKGLPRLEEALEA